MTKALVILTTLGLLVLAGCTLLSPAPTPVPTPIPISHIYAFGDAYTDNGNLKRLWPTNVDWENYWEGRFSNGPVAVEVLATRLNVELTDYAVEGAKSGTDNFANPLPNTGALGQIEQFKTELKGQSTDPRALYFVMIGACDFYETVHYRNGELGDNSALAEKAVDNIATGITQLAQLGAKRFLVGTEPDMAVTPYMIRYSLSEQAAEFQTLLNSKLPGRVNQLKAQLGIEIDLFDGFGLSTQIRENPANYGLTNTTDPCRPLGQSACASPDEYYFWDEWDSPTRRIHQIFGEAMAALYGK